ncbi:hypothetical protein [Methylophaga sp.]|uniref:hypothetical protein n=1 Tax=Methylophaga sp. TaxID=2024840 RepID=UPI003F6A324D
MANILLGKTHKSLIKAAIGLGNWFLSLEQLSEQDKQAVKQIQSALEKLPKVNDGTLAMYGFSIEKGDNNNGLVRGWDVSLEYFSQDEQQQGGLELFSSFIPLPETTDPAVLKQKKLNEVYFHWPIGDVCAFINPEQAKQWVDEVSHPLNSWGQSDRLRIEIVYQDYYSEIDNPLS